MIEYVLLPSECARHIPSKMRGHVWGLHAIIGEVCRVLTDSKSTPSADLERACCMLAFFLQKMSAGELPTKMHRLGDTVEGHMVDLIYRCAEAEWVQKLAAKGRARMQELLSTGDRREVLGESEYVKQAMHIYEDAFRAAKAQRIQFLDGCFGTRK